MDMDLSAPWDKLQALLDRALALLPNLVLGALVFVPFPTTQILFHDQTEETDGDRGRQREGWPAAKHKPVPKAMRLGEAIRGLASGAAAERRP